MWCFLHKDRTANDVDLQYISDPASDGSFPNGRTASGDALCYSILMINRFWIVTKNRPKKCHLIPNVLSSRLRLLECATPYAMHELALILLSMASPKLHVIMPHRRLPRHYSHIRMALRILNTVVQPSAIVITTSSESFFHTLLLRQCLTFS